MKKILLIFTFLSTQMFGFSQNFEQIAHSFATANTKELLTFFNTDVELSLNDNIVIKGKTQAEAELRSFFLTHQPNAMKIIHKGVSKNDVHYFIGQLNTSEGTFRVTAYMQKQGELHLIETLEIEK